MSVQPVQHDAQLTRAIVADRAFEREKASPIRCKLNPLALGASAICFANRQRFIERDRPFGDPVRERRPFDQLHNHRGHAGGVLDAIDMGDVGMVQCRECFGFSLQAGEPVWVRRDIGREHLDRHVAIQLAITGAIDLTHAPGANQRQDLASAETSAGAQSHAQGESVSGL